MSSLLQSTGSSPYVLVHIVCPLAATGLRLVSVCLLRSSPDWLEDSSSFNVVCSRLHQDLQFARLFYVSLH